MTFILSVICFNSFADDVKVDCDVTNQSTFDGANMNCLKNNEPADARHVNANFKVLLNKILQLEATVQSQATTIAGLQDKNCPTGFTSIEKTVNDIKIQLGCMQIAKDGQDSWENASNTCFTTYGGRLPTSGEWYIAMQNYSLTGETDDWEWNNDAISGTDFNQHVASGNADITNSRYGNDSDTNSYRCWIPTQ